MIAIREDIAMAFFKRELSPVKRFKNALRDKQVARQKLADRLSIAETILGERRVAAERLAVAGATNAQLERAEANLRAVEDRAKALRAALAELDEQIVSTERALADAKAQRGPIEAARQKLADRLSIAETILGERRVAAERLAVAGATNAQLERAEANLRAVEDRAKALRAALAELDEQIVSTERALADAKAQRD